MLCARESLDKRISLILSKCKDSAERISMDPEIAQMYMNINEPKIARSYMERYCQKYKEPSALVFLGNIYEKINEYSSALKAYRAAFEHGYFDGDLLSHISTLLKTLALPKSDIQFWNRLVVNQPDKDRSLTSKILQCTSHHFFKTIDLRESLKTDPHNVEYCLEYIKNLEAEKSLKHLLEHCERCVAAGYHDESAVWFRSVSEILELSGTSTNPSFESLKVSIHMMLLRSSGSSESLANFVALLRNLNSMAVPRSNMAAFLQETVQSWLYFYTAVYLLRCAIDGKIERKSALLRELLQRSVEHANLHTEPLDNPFWKRMRCHQSEVVLQALCLQKSEPYEPTLESLTWNQLMCEIEDTSAEFSNLSSATPFRNLAVLGSWYKEFLEPHGVPESALALAKDVRENMGLIIWACGRISGQDILGDQALTTERLDFIFEFFSMAFPDLNLTSSPMPNGWDNLSGAALSSSDTCQLDLACFLLVIFLRTFIKSLQNSGNTESEGTLSDWSLPLCLIPPSQLPTATQLRWWASLVKILFKRGCLNTASPTDAALIQCGLHQLRLLNRPTTCPGTQSSNIPVPILLRVANALTLYASTVKSSKLKEAIMDWTVGYWLSAIKRHVFGDAPPTQFLSPQMNKTTPSRSGRYTALNDIRRISVGSPRMAKICHPLFAMDQDCDYWTGFYASTVSNQSPESQLVDFGMYHVLHRLQERFASNGMISFSEKSMFRCISQLLDKGDKYFSPDSYQLYGQLIVLHGGLDLNESGEEGTSVHKPHALVPGFGAPSPGLRTPSSLSRGRINVHSSPIYSLDRKGLGPWAPSLPHSPLIRTQPESTNNANSACAPAQFTLETELADAMSDILPYSQELVMAAFINSWQSLINGLSSQLAETKAEIAKSRQLNEELSKKLNETTSQLSVALQKFTECQKTMHKEPDHTKSQLSDEDRLYSPLGKPIHELSQAINDLRQWLPLGLASAATAAVQAQLSGRITMCRPDDPSSFVNMYGPNLQMGAVAPFPPFPYMPVPAASMNWQVPLPNMAPVIGELHPTRFPPNSASATSPDLLPTTASTASTFQPALTQPRPFLRPAINAAGQLSTVPATLTPGTQILSPGAQALQSPNKPPATQLLGPFNPTLRSPQLTPGQLSTVQVMSTVVTSSPAFAPALCSQSTTPSFGGFRFSSPEVQTTPTTSAKPTEKPSSQPSFGFGNLRLGSPQSTNLFTPKSVGSTPAPKATDRSTNSPGADQSGNDLHPEEEEPRVDFKPVLDVLPDKVEEVTGEEDEERVFNDRARLYRYDKASSSWKTRGVGEVRILRHPVLGTYRLVMRRDQIKKLCANHSLTSGLKVTQHSKDPRMAMWAVKDFADSIEGKDELFMIQFKSADILSEFMATFESCVSKSGSAPVSKPTSDKQSGNVSAGASHSAETGGVPVSTQQENPLAAFLPKPGSWTCSTCLLSQSPDAQSCMACGTAKPGTSTAESKPSSGSAPLFGTFTMGSGGFVFGQTKPSTAVTTNSKPLFSVIGTNPEKVSFSASGDSTNKDSTTSFRFGTGDAATTASDVKTSSSGGIFSSISLFPDSSKSAAPTGFSFTFGLPAQSKDLNTSVKSVDSPSKSVHDSDSEHVEQVDDANLSFRPVLSVLPEKVEVVTGEENEEVVFSERAKLYRWDSKMWRERGVGVMKLLRLPDTDSVRCVMRRDHVLKVCCNHPITHGMQLKPMNSGDGRALTWWAIDFTEPTLDEQQQQEVQILESGGRREVFAIRFKTLEHAEAFRRAFESAADAAQHSDSSTVKVDKISTQLKSVDLDEKQDSDGSDVLIVEKPPQVSAEQLSRARALHLPDEFFLYENGVITGVGESMSAEELAAEDKLLEMAIRSQSSESTTEAKTPVPSEKGDTSAEQTKTPIKVTPVTQPLTNGMPGTGLGSGPFSSSSGLLDFSSLSAAVSDSTKPLWGQKSSSTWSTTCTPLFAKSQPTEPTAANDNENADDSTEHDPQYEPIIPLPDLVQTKSGEESEVCIYIRRCRLYRFTDNAWRERGIGEVKVLLLPQTLPTDYQPGSREVFENFEQLGPVKSARLLMRREQVLKLCLNQSIGSGVPSFRPMGAAKLGLVWAAVDYSEGTANRELLAIRFKNEDDLSEFKSAVAKAQSLLPQS